MNAKDWREIFYIVLMWAAFMTAVVLRSMQ